MAKNLVRTKSCEMKKGILLLCFSLYLGIFYGQVPTTSANFKQQQKEFIRQAQHPITIEMLPREINTQYSEYKGILLSDSLFYFNTMRANGTENTDMIFGVHWTADIYFSHLGEYGYSKAYRISNVLNNNKFYNTNFTLDSAGNTLFFVRTHKKAEEPKGNIWLSYKIDGEWEKPKILPATINMEGYNNNFPHWVDMGNYAILYFCSDRPGGEGGMDIWYSIARDGKFEHPINAGPIINTEGNEITPFYDKKRAILYFSSDEHIGIGGYDIFYAEGAMSQWSSPSNMGVPINSEDNDIYLTINSDGRSGYFSSNRPNKVFDENNKCCNDLYSFRYDLKQKKIEEKSDTLIVDQKSAIESVPLLLYFDNDQPEPRTTRTTTQQTYDRTFLEYMSRETLYIQNCRDSLEANRMQKFFRNTVAGGYQQLIRTTEEILNYLQAGDTLTLTIYGHASLLHNSNYNLHLSERRIHTLLNFFQEYKNGALLPYLAKNGNGQLRFITIPKGSNESAEKREEKGKNSSIYTLSACKERKIEIRSIEISPAKR